MPASWRCELVPLRNQHSDAPRGVRDANGGYVLPPWPTTAMPGSEEKVQFLAERAAKSGDWDAWLEACYGKHRAILVDALGPAIAVLGGKITAEDLADRLIAESKQILDAAYNSDTPAQFAARLAAWAADRTRSAAAAILDQR